MKLTLAAARKNAGLTQAQAAKLLNVGKSTICSWERGYIEPRVNQARALCELYGVPIDCIFFTKEVQEK